MRRRPRRREREDDEFVEREKECARREEDASRRADRAAEREEECGRCEAEVERRMAWLEEEVAAHTKERELVEALERAWWRGERLQKYSKFKINCG